MKEKKKNILKNDKAPYIVAIIVISFILFNSINFVFKKNNLYKFDEGRKWDRFFSYDDLYYAKYIFNKDLNQTILLPHTHIKHPLFAVGGHAFTKIEKSFYPKLSFQNHYHLIIMFQNVVSIIGVVFLFLIMYDCLKLKIKTSFLLSLIFLFSSTIIISSTLIETFVFSSSLLILSYYFISKKKYYISGVLGALIFGVTITNIIPWAIMVLFLVGIKDYKNLFKIAVSALVALLIFTGIIYLYNSDYITVYFTNCYKTIKYNAEYFEAKFNAVMIIKYFFYYLFVAPFFYINTVNSRPDGLFHRQSVYFEPSANIFIIILSVLLLLGIILLAIKLFSKDRDRNILCCLTIIFYNILLHGVLKFGLHEGFLYAPHILFAYIIMFALLFKHFPKYNKHISYFAFIFLIIQLFNNFRFINEAILAVGKVFGN